MVSLSSAYQSQDQSQLPIKQRSGWVSGPNNYGYSTGQQDLQDPYSTTSTGSQITPDFSLNVSGQRGKYDSPDFNPNELGPGTIQDWQNATPRDLPAPEGDNWTLPDFSKYLPSNGLSGSSMLFPAMAAAWKQYNDSGKYTDLGNSAANRADPFGSQRAQYQKRLSDIYNDPTAVLNDPQHRAVVDKQVGAIDARNRAGGYMGSGKANMDIADYQAKSDAQYLNDEKARLAELSGAQFNPASAGQLMMQGGQLGLQSSSAALDTLMRPWTASMAPKGAGSNQIDNLTGDARIVADAVRTAGAVTPAARAAVRAFSKDGNTILDGMGKVVAVKGGDGSWYNADPTANVSGVGGPPSYDYGNSDTPPQYDSEQTPPDYSGDPGYIDAHNDWGYGSNYGGEDLGSISDTINTFFP